MTDPPLGGGGGTGGSNGGDLGLGLGDLDVAILSHKDRVDLQCLFLEKTWTPPSGEDQAGFCEPYSGRTTVKLLRYVVFWLVRTTDSILIQGSILSLGEEATSISIERVRDKDSFDSEKYFVNKSSVAIYQI